MSDWLYTGGVPSHRLRRDVLEYELLVRGWSVGELASQASLGLRTVERAYGGMPIRGSSIHAILRAFNDNPPLPAGELLEKP